MIANPIAHRPCLLLQLLQLSLHRVQCEDPGSRPFARAPLPGLPRKTQRRRDHLRAAGRPPRGQCESPRTTPRGMGHEPPLPMQSPPPLLSLLKLLPHPPPPRSLPQPCEQSRGWRDARPGRRSKPRGASRSQSAGPGRFPRLLPLLLLPPPPLPQSLALALSLRREHRTRASASHVPARARWLRQSGPRCASERGRREQCCKRLCLCPQPHALRTLHRRQRKWRCCCLRTARRPRERESSTRVRSLQASPPPRPPPPQRSLHSHP